MTQIMAPPALTVREAADFADALRCALNGAPGPVGLDMGACGSCDALGFQVVEAARRTAADHGILFDIGGTRQPSLVACLRRLGATPASHPHWFAEVTA